LLESQKPPRIYCFQADYLASQQFNPQEIPAWLSLEVNWQGYRIHTLPWVADVARVLGLLAIEDTPQGWQDYLESLGLAKIRLMDSEEFFGSSLPFMLNQQTRCQDNILLTQKLRKFLKP